MKIILSTALALVLLGCSDSAESNHAKQEIQKQLTESVSVISKSTQEVIEKAKEASKEIVKQAEVVSKESVKEVKETTGKVVATVAHETAKVAKKVEEEVKVPTPSTVPAIDGAKLYTACAGCHGSHGERKALGKSAIIQGWEATKTHKALLGYKDGSYGGSMKGVMKSQISKFNDAELEALAKHIAAL